VAPPRAHFIIEEQLTTWRQRRDNASVTDETNLYLVCTISIDAWLSIYEHLYPERYRDWRLHQQAQIMPWARDIHRAQDAVLSRAGAP
jgi:hypothetical protein